MKAFRERARRGKTIAEADITVGMKCFSQLEHAVGDVVRAGLTRTKDVAALAEAVWASGHGLVSLVITHDNFGFTEPKRLVEVSLDLTLNGLLKR